MAALEEQHHPLEILNEITRIATLDLELRPMMQRITDALARNFDWEFVALVMVDRDRNVFVCEAVTTDTPTLVSPGYSRPLGSGVVGEVAATELPILLDDVRSYPSFIETLRGTMSELCMPVKFQGQLVAILNLESSRLGAFHDQLPVVITVAEQIAGAIASARRFEELRRRARLMEMMSEVSRTALEATDLGELLQRIASFIHQRFPIEVVEILLFDEQEQAFLETASAGAIGEHPVERWGPATGVIGRCIRRRQGQLVLDVTTDPDYLAINPRVTSELVVPIHFKRRILGVVNLESASPEVFTPANVLAFEAFADQVAGAIHLASITKDLEEANARLQRLSMLDALTGIANRRRFDEVYDIEWRRAARAHSPVSLLMIDIDEFKAYNDAYGHRAGDDCLRRVAEALRTNVHRASDLVARYGGEEFAVLLPLCDTMHAGPLAEILRNAVARLEIRHEASTVARVVTISVGVATLTPAAEMTDAELLIRSADDALYEAKRGGRNRVVVH